MNLSVCVMIVAAFIVLIFATGEAAVARADFSNPDYPGKCVISSDLILSPGQSGKAPNNPCASAQCMDNGFVEFRTCPAVAPPKGCKMRDFVNTDRTYPECCERAYDCTRSF